MLIKIWKGENCTQLTCQPGQTLLELLRSRPELAPAAPCGGAGTCGKCRVALADGSWVLACQTQVQDGLELRLPEGETPQVLLQAAEQAPFSPDPGQSDLGIACDIGTTTLVCHLVERSTGRVLATLGQGNRQQSYGADVIARILAASQGQLPQLQATLIHQLGEMIRQLAHQAQVPLAQVTAMAVAANTTMCHLLTGLDPEGLGHAPFRPQSTFGEVYDAQVLGLPFSGAVYLAPAVSGYVGGDITADLLALDLPQRNGPALLIDVGTNGEMVLGCRSRLLCCSTAAGPAFEGAQIAHGMTAQPGAIHAVTCDQGQLHCAVLGGGPPKGICGSGLIDAIAVMLELGALDETGRIQDPEEDDIPHQALPYLTTTPQGEPAFRLTEQIWVTQGDVRKVQLGKGAIAAGVQVLLQAYGIAPEQVEALYLAGGFGSYLRPASAGRIGLIPQVLLPVTRAVGNVAAVGARRALLSQGERGRLEALARQMEYIELSGDPRFNQAYMEAMLFPEQDEL